MKHLIVVLLLLASGLLRAADTAAPTAQPALPRLVDLGAGKCIPCKMMKPILDELTREYAGQFEVVFIDVWENREEGAKYGIRLIPTQIFYGADGKERFRHEGFMAKKDILAKWQDLGVVLKEPVPPVLEGRARLPGATSLGPQTREADESGRPGLPAEALAQEGGPSLPSETH